MDYTSYCPGCFGDKGSRDPCPYCGYKEKVVEASLYLPPRTILAEKYLIGRTLGQGGFGITYLGWDLNLKLKLAIKEFFPQGLVSRLPGQSRIVSYSEAENNNFDFWLERFLEEARTLARFEQHPNIVSVRDFFKANNTAYMIMSYIEGITLDQYLARVGGKLPCNKAIAVMMPVMDALREVHEAGVMHRDVSPDNIFIDNRGRVVLIDFGAARQEIKEKSKSLSIILKSGYAPEEQYRSRGKQGPWTDVYAVGATIYRLITGTNPPDALDRLAEDTISPPSQSGVAISAEQEQILLKAMAVKAVDRFQAVDQLQAALLASDQKTKEKAGSAAPERAAASTEHAGLRKHSAEPDAAGATGKGDSSILRKKVLSYAAAVILGALLLYGGVSFFGSSAQPAIQETEEAEPVDETQRTGAGNGSESEDENITQPGTGFPVELISSRLLSDGDDYIHGFTYGYNYLWASTRTSPTRILRINPHTLDYDRLILPSGYDMAEDIIAHDGYIWAITYTVPTRLIRIDPYNLQYDVPVEFKPGEIDYGGALEYANNYLWAGGVGAIARVDLNSMSYDLYSYAGIDRQIHALAAGGGYLWAAVPRNHTLLRINLNNPSSSTRITESNLYISDDMVFVNGHLFAGTENELPYRILKIAPDLSYADTVQPSGCYGVFTVRDEIWATNISTSGIITRYDFDLNPTGDLLLPAGFNDPNELVVIDDNIYVTTWQSPAGILNYQIENAP